MAFIEKRRTKVGDVRWEVRYRALDGSERSKTWRTKGEAHRFAVTVEADKARGGFVDPRRGRVTVAEYATEYIDSNHRLRDRSRETYSDLLRLHIIPELGNIELSRLTVDRVRRWNAKLSATYPSTAAKSYRLLRTVMNAAVADERVVRNPCALKGAGIERAGERPTATAEQVWALADAIDDRYRIAIVLGGFVGLRVGEILGLENRHANLLLRTLNVEQQQIQLRDGTLQLGEPKTAAGKRVLALPEFVVAEIQGHLDRHGIRGRGDRLLSGERGGPLRKHVLHKHWRRACTDVGLKEGFHFHDLRHSAMTFAASTGATTSELMKRFGHTSPAIALRYQHAAAERDRVLADGIGLIAESGRRGAAR